MAWSWLLAKPRPLFNRRDKQMETRVILVPLLLGLSLPLASVQAQRVSADFRVFDGPVSAHVVVGRRPDYPRSFSSHPLSIRRVAVAERDHPRVIVVERLHRGRGYWRHHGFRRFIAYYDQDGGTYYDRYDHRFPALREVAVYERDGRYYRDDYRQNGNHHRDNDD